MSSGEGLSPELTLARLRRFLLALAGALLVGALVELSFSGHTGEPVQWLPFILCGLGLLAIGLAWLRPGWKTTRFLRGVMWLALAGSVFGTLVHIVRNITFQLEINPGLTLLERLAEGLGGANPLLAPGILGIAAVLALAACYGVPAD